MKRKKVNTMRAKAFMGAIPVLGHQSSVLIVDRLPFLSTRPTPRNSPYLSVYLLFGEDGVVVSLLQTPPCADTTIRFPCATPR